jgi:hypothetical protein
MDFGCDENNEAWVGGMGFRGPEWANLEVIAQFGLRKKCATNFNLLIVVDNRKSVPN